MSETLVDPHPDDRFDNLTEIFIHETPELVALTDSEQQETAGYVSMMLQDVHNVLKDSTIGTEQFRSLGVDLHDKDERIIVVFGKKLESGTELNARWISDPLTIKKLKKNKV